MSLSVRLAFASMLAIAPTHVATGSPAIVGAGLPAIASTATPFYATRFERAPTPAELATLGAALFREKELSASGRLSCASCHDPDRAFGPPNALPVQLGGPDGTLAGLRATPSLKYLQFAPPFIEHFYDVDGNDSEDQGPAGGFMWDGRALSAHDQARLPLTSPFEMANDNDAAVVDRLAGSASAGAFRAAFGAHVFADPALAFRALSLALEVFEQSPASFAPHDSKYDAYLRGDAKLSPLEARGLALFDDPAKGNCARCHPSAVKYGVSPLFTDWGFVAIAAPRNRALAANADPHYFDLGLCGPVRTDLADRDDYCGRFRTPTLRNVALRPVFFHNGGVASLRDAVRFYAERDVRPEKWYPRAADGHVELYDDLPARYWSNVERESPFGGKPGDAPVLDDGEIDAIVAFLETLTDGWRAERAGLHSRGVP